LSGAVSRGVRRVANSARNHARAGCSISAYEALLISAKLTVEALPEISITAAFRKNYDQGFCTPLDLPRAFMVKRYLQRSRSLKHLVPLR